MRPTPQRVQPTQKCANTISLGGHRADVAGSSSLGGQRGLRCVPGGLVSNPSPCAHPRTAPGGAFSVVCASQEGVCAFRGLSLPGSLQKVYTGSLGLSGGKSKQVSGWMLLPGRSVLVPAGAFLGRCELETKSVALGYPVRICQSLCRKQGMTLYPLEREPSEVVL